MVDGPQPGAQPAQAACPAEGAVCLPRALWEGSHLSSRVAVLPTSSAQARGDGMQGSNGPVPQSCRRCASWKWECNPASPRDASPRPTRWMDRAEARRRCQMPATDATAAMEGRRQMPQPRCHCQTERKPDANYCLMPTTPEGCHNRDATASRRRRTARRTRRMDHRRKETDEMRRSQPTLSGTRATACRRATSRARTQPSSNGCPNGWEDTQGR